VAQASASQQKLAGAAGVHLDVSGVGEIVVGEQPRARGRAGAAQASGTGAEAAVDLVRVRLLGQDLRMGHMEAAVAVPAAGLTCPALEVSMTPEATAVTPGSDFAVKVRVRNPNEGIVSGLTVASRMAADPGVNVDGGPVSRDNVVAPNGAGFKLTTPLGPGRSVELPARVHVGAASGPGRVRLGATASGQYGDGPLAVRTTGDIAVDGPLVSLATNPSSPPPGPATKNPVGGKAPATVSASSPTGSGGRKPVRASAGITGAAGSAVSAAPVAPAPIPVTPAPIPPVAEPAPAPAPEQAPAPAPAPEQAAAPKPKVNPTDRRRWGWAGAAAALLVAVAAAGVARLTAGR
jgi:hypothetical protein